MPIISVGGFISEDDLGITLPHEHLFVDLSFSLKESGMTCKRISEEKVSLENLHLLKNNPGFLKDNLLLDDEGLIKEELMRFRLAGGKTIVDQSSVGAGRCPDVLARISEETGLNIVMGTGYYLRQSLPDCLTNASETELIESIVNEARFGIGSSQIRPGIIGEIGINPIIGEWDKKLLRVVSKAQRETGLPLSIHIQAVPTIPGFNPQLNGLDVLKILKKEGAFIDKVVICHADAKIDLEYIKEIIGFGAFVEFDHFGKEFYYREADFLMDRDMDRVLALRELIRMGFTNNLLISQDVCLKTDLVRYGGFGYAHILNDVVPVMLRKGITREEVDILMVENPKRLLNVDGKYF